ncbi:unnamed protein product, partial [Mesorhabditis spiculigera]
MDVRAELNAIELLSNDDAKLPSQLRNSSEVAEGPLMSRVNSGAVCMPPIAFSLFLSLSAAAVAVLSAIVVFALRPIRKC